MNGSVGSVASAVSDTTSVSAASTSDSLTASANATPDAKSILNNYKKMQKKAVERLKEKRDLTNERKAAAGRYKKAGASQATGISAIAATDVGTFALPDGMDPGGMPHYYGPYPNYANSPMPTFTAVATLATVGNPLIDRAYASDYPVAVGELAPVFVVVPSAVLPAGTLLNFQTWNQAMNGESPFPSAGNIFYAYVLRPTGILNQYQYL